MVSENPTDINTSVENIIMDTLTSGPSSTFEISKQANYNMQTIYTVARRLDDRGYILRVGF
jgi:hypothetical protein